MSEQVPSVTAVIAARPDQADVSAVAGAQQLDYPAERLEILVVRGRHPSVQRNEAIRAARGEWIYFLDDDTVPGPGNLREALKFLADPAVKMVGGPNLCPPHAPPIERVFAVVLGSWLAFGPSRARYAKVGRARPASEKALILCNLLARRDAILELGGFNEALYPNEENALMDALQQRGDKLIYDPEFVAHRRPRKTLKAFAVMLLTYGRGRAEQFRVRPTPGSFLNFAPPLFCAYLLLLLIALPVFGAVPAVGWAAAPLALYLLAVLAQTAVSVPDHGLARSLFAAPILAISPILYGLGFWRGLFTALDRDANRARAEVRLEKISGIR